ncbi:hypothetical protein [Shimia thalassica]|uniref:hypothetical protein n=1 Tax=Shimia thalassica TaxID=1715693 RepID=UPI0026E22F2B|nr:hypothetical protein [Shimia thalassica]MDO6480955.1 hypothetical protein [Shimia thalassica]
MENLKIIDWGAKVSALLNLQSGLYAVIAEGVRDGVGLYFGWQVFPLIGSEIIKLEGGGISRAELVSVGPETGVEIYLGKIEALN